MFDVSRTMMSSTSRFGWRWSGVLALVLCASLAHAEAALSVITVKITGLRSEEGQALVALYDSPEPARARHGHGRGAGRDPRPAADFDTDPNATPAAAPLRPADPLRREARGRRAGPPTSATPPPPWARWAPVRSMTPRTPADWADRADPVTRTTATIRRAAGAV